MPRRLLAMVDAFPASATDADYQMQLQIDAALRHAQSVRAQGESGASLLYPALFAADPRLPWMLPLLRRLASHRAQTESSAVWQRMLREMLGLALEALSGVTEEEFEAWTDELELYERTIRAFAAAVGKEGPASPNLVAALARVQRVTATSRPAKPRRSETRRAIHAPAAESEGNPCWSAGVRRDLEAMPPKLRALWLEALVTGFNRSSDYSAVPAKSTLRALKRLGNPEVEARLRRWIGMLHEGHGPVLTPDGAVMLQRVIELCHLLGGAVSDELLYAIARASWTQEPHPDWLKTYLWALGNRSQDHAFACLEALMMNPVMAVAGVRRQYEALLAVFSAPGTDSPLGVDGFELDSDPALAPQQKRIDQFLRMAATAASGGSHVDPQVEAVWQHLRSTSNEDLTPSVRAAIEAGGDQTSPPSPWFEVAPEVSAAKKAMEAAILKEFSADPGSLYRAVAVRSRWIEAHKREYDKDTLVLWEEWLFGLGCRQGLVSKAFAKVEELSLEGLVRALETGGCGLRLFDLCEKYVAKYGWHIDLVEPFRRWIPSIGTATSDLIPRQRAEWFVWFENVAPIDLDACWSHRVKRDLREMPPEESANWRALLDNTVFIVTGKPTAKWLKAAEKAFPKVGADAFRTRFVNWFEPFAKGEPFRMTVSGRNILRILMWCALLAKDSVVDEALLGFANARWKTKEVAKRVAQAEMAFSYVLAERMPETALPVLEAFVASGQAFAGSATHGVYKELCARWNRTPVRPGVQPAISPKGKPEKTPAADPPPDSHMLADLRRVVRIRESHPK